MLNGKLIKNHFIIITTNNLKLLNYSSFSFLILLFKNFMLMQHLHICKYILNEYLGGSKYLWFIYSTKNSIFDAKFLLFSNE